MSVATGAVGSAAPIGAGRAVGDPVTARVGLRERKKDATRRALAEAALDLAVARGYAAVTIADITDAVGVSRRTFSNYFAGKAECVAAVIEGWFDDIVDTIRWAPADSRLETLLFDALSRFAADLPERWDRFYGLFHDEPELKAMADAMDEAELCRAGRRHRTPVGDGRGRHPGADARNVRLFGRPNLPGGLGAPRKTRRGTEFPDPTGAGLLDHRSGSARRSEGRRRLLTDHLPTLRLTVTTPDLDRRDPSGDR